MKLLTFILLNIFCFSVVSLCGQENNSNTTIEFIVLDSISNKTLSEVEVQIYGSNGVDVYKTTNNEGKVVFSNQEHKELFEEGVTYVDIFKENYFKKNYNVLDFKSGIETKKYY